MGSGELAAADVEWEEGADQINECEYLFAHSIREIEELTLELTLTEAKAQAQALEPRTESIGAPLSQCHPIQTDETCRSFRLVFDRNRMVSYTVLNESYGKYPESPEQFTGKLFRVFSRSHLLEFTRRTTNASDEYPGVLQHYQIACLNHVVDVICTGPPRITVGRAGAR